MASFESVKTTEQENQLNNNMVRLGLDPRLTYNYNSMSPVETYNLSKGIVAEVRDNEGGLYVFTFAYYPPLNPTGGTYLPDSFLEYCVKAEKRIPVEYTSDEARVLVRKLLNEQYAWLRDNEDISYALNELVTSLGYKVEETITKKLKSLISLLLELDKRVEGLGDLVRPYKSYLDLAVSLNTDAAIIAAIQNEQAARLAKKEVEAVETVPVLDLSYECEQFITRRFEAKIQPQWVLSRQGIYKFTLAEPNLPFQIEVPIDKREVMGSDGNYTLVIKDWAQLVQSGEANVYFNNERINIPVNLKVLDLSDLVNSLPLNEPELYTVDLINNMQTLLDMVELLSGIGLAEVDLVDKFIKSKIGVRYLKVDGGNEIRANYLLKRRIENLLFKGYMALISDSVERLSGLGLLAPSNKSLLSNIKALLRKAETYLPGDIALAGQTWPEKLARYFDGYAINGVAPSSYSNIFDLISRFEEFRDAGYE